MRNSTLFATGLLLLCRMSIAQTLGDVCVPGSVEPRPGITCQATDEFDYFLPHVGNAKKGDVLLSAGCGLIGGLLRHVDPPQRFSHSGIMVENWARLRHSTASEDRFVASAGSDGFVPEILKFGWPGTITQTIDEAYEGRYFPDPEDEQKTFFVESFNRNPLACPQDAAAIFPSVVKPPFDLESSPVGRTGRTVRATLEGIADAAQGIRGHYRFFAYSDADIVGRVSGPGAQAPPEAGWAHFEGPNGTVCSQLIWSSARATGVQLEDGTVEPGDRPHSSSPTLNGLYLYSEAERRAAGDWMYDEIYNRFYDQAGWLGRLLTDAPDDGANQILNCFGFDWCGSEPGMEFDGEPDAKDSERWKTPGAGTAVSPDDITHWDAPPAGVYGLTEDMAYHPGEYVRVHRWAASAGTGEVAVTVTYSGAPVAGALVILAGFPAATTDAAGVARFVAIPSGRYQLDGRKTVREAGNDREVTASTTVDVQAGRTNSVALTLTGAPPPRPETSRAIRRVTVRGTVFIKDHEDFGSNETGTHTIDASVVLDPAGQRTHTFNFSHCTGDEVRVETTVRVSLNPSDRSVSAEVRGKLFEGSSCDTDEEEDNATRNFAVGEDGSGNVEIHLVNGSVFGDDEGRIRLTVLNERNPGP